MGDTCQTELPELPRHRLKLRYPDDSKNYVDDK